MVLRCSVLGGPPIPMSTDPVKMFEQVMPQVQKRIMEALADTGFWSPILIDFIRDHVLTIPAVQSALGGLNINIPTGPLALPSTKELKAQALAIIQTKQAEVCKQATSDISDASDTAEKSIAKVKIIHIWEALHRLHGTNTRAHALLPHSFSTLHATNTTHTNFETA